MTDVMYTLGTLPPGSTGLVSASSADDRISTRLAELGLRVGAHVRIVARSSGGGRIVAVNGSRIAVDARTLSLIAIDPVAGDPAPSPARTALGDRNPLPNEA